MISMLGRSPIGTGVLTSGAGWWRALGFVAAIAVRRATSASSRARVASDGCPDRTREVAGDGSPGSV
jgi:hypothetical protein